MAGGLEAEEGEGAGKGGLSQREGGVMGVEGEQSAPPADTDAVIAQGDETGGASDSAVGPQAAQRLLIPWDPGDYGRPCWA